MKKNYFLLEDFNALQKHLETLRADLKKLGGQMQAALNKSSVMDGDSMSNAISELFEQQQGKIRDLEKLTINPQIMPVLRNAEYVTVGAYVQIKNCDADTVKWYHIRGAWFKPEEGKTGETIETAIPLTNSSPVVLRCIGKTVSNTVLIRRPDETSFYYIQILDISLGLQPSPAR